MSSTDSESAAPSISPRTKDREFVLTRLLNDLKNVGRRCPVEFLTENMSKYLLLSNKIQTVKLSKLSGWQVYRSEYIASKKTDDVKQTFEVCRKLGSEGAKLWKENDDIRKTYNERAIAETAKNTERWRNYYANKNSTSHDAVGHINIDTISCMKRPEILHYLGQVESTRNVVTAKTNLKDLKNMLSSLCCDCTDQRPITTDEDGN